MNKSTLFLILIIGMISACKKKETITPMPEPAPLTDFLYLPVKDAEWRVHLRGNIMIDVVFCDGLLAGQKDTAWNLYETIKSLGTDTFIAGKKYYRYKAEQYAIYTRKPCEGRYQEGESFYFLREDTANQQVYCYSGQIHDTIYETLIVDFSTEKVGDNADVPAFWPDSYISGLNNVVINGQRAKMWEVAYKYDPHKKFFYKAYGIGNQAGILPPAFFLTYSEPVSLDFTYKGQTNHFEFDIHDDKHTFNVGYW